MTDTNTKTCEFSLEGLTIRFSLPDPNDHIQSHILRTRSFYEEHMLREASALLPKGGTVVDIGANIGNHTIFFAKLLGANVLAFEPNPAAVKQLRDNVAINGAESLVRIHDVALGSSSGRGVVSLDDAGNLGKAQVLASETGDIEISTLDHFVGEEPVDLIKIDVEGMECEVLNGGLETLRRCQPSLLIEAATADHLMAIEAILRPLGYRKVAVYNHTPTYLFRMFKRSVDGVFEALGQLPSAIRAKLPETRGIFAGMASIPGNEDGLRAAVTSIVPQVDKLFLTLNGFDEAPEFLAGMDKVQYHLEPDGARYGDAGKFWGLQFSESSIYLTCDDDIVYPRDYAVRMATELAWTGGKAIVCAHGSLLSQPFENYYDDSSRAVLHFQQSQLHRRYVHVPGTGTCAFHTATFNPALEDFLAPNMADIWVTKFAREGGIPCINVPRQANWLIPIAVRRPSIYEQSRTKSGGSYDTGDIQSKTLASLGLITIRDVVKDAPAFVLTASADSALSEHLPKLSFGARDPLFFVLCDNAEDTRRRSGRIGYEVHFVERHQPLAPEVRSLLSSIGGRLILWDISNAKAQQMGSTFEAWIDGAFAPTLN
ncbi:FkbM family methyltransferase [Rhizobium sp. 0TCS1.26]|uniref:FkbM family methyltransferase n=1 Tax=Rhizobium sp. 0TCS1.26 TaxID=3142623 RepID=UPI003D269EBC